MSVISLWLMLVQMHKFHLFVDNDCKWHLYTCSYFPDFKAIIRLVAVSNDFNNDRQWVYTALYRDSWCFASLPCLCYYIMKMKIVRIIQIIRSMLDVALPLSCELHIPQSAFVVSSMNGCSYSCHCCCFVCCWFLDK